MGTRNPSAQPGLMAAMEGVRLDDDAAGASVTATAERIGSEDEEEAENVGDDSDAEEDDEDADASGAGGASSAAPRARGKEGPQFKRAQNAGFAGTKGAWKQLSVLEKDAFIKENEPARSRGPRKGPPAKDPPDGWLTESEDNSMEKWNSLTGHERRSVQKKRSRYEAASGGGAEGGGGGGSAAAGGGGPIDLGDNAGPAAAPAKRSRGQNKPKVAPSTEADQRRMTEAAKRGVVLALSKYELAVQGRGAVFCVLHDDVAERTTDGRPGRAAHDDAASQSRTTLRISTQGAAGVLNTISMMNGGSAPAELGEYQAFASATGALAHLDEKAAARTGSYISSGPAEAIAFMTRAATPPASPAPAPGAAGGA